LEGGLPTFQTVRDKAEPGGYFSTGELPTPAPSGFLGIDFYATER